MDVQSKPGHRKPTVAEELHALCADGKSDDAVKRIASHVGELVSDAQVRTLDVLLRDVDPANLTDEAVAEMLKGIYEVDGETIGGVKGLSHRLLHLSDFEHKARVAGRLK